MGKKVILINVEKCYECKKCQTECDYFYRINKTGIYDVIEKAIRTAVCRHCDDPVCIKACGKDALEKTENGYIKRHNLKCVGCNSCIYACFLGAHFGEITSMDVPLCDDCKEIDSPSCVSSCPEGALELCDENELPENAEKISDRFYVLVKYPIINPNRRV